MKRKNDKLDARYIAKYIASDDHEFKSYRILSYHLKALKLLSIFRESLVHNHSSYLVIVLIFWIRFKDFFNNRLTNTALFILKKHKKLSRIAKFTRDDMVCYHNYSKCIPVSKFEDLKKLAKNTIGQEDHRGKIVKRGSSHLRYNLMNVICSVRLNNLVPKTFYDKKRIIEKKPIRVAEIHTVKKLIRIIFALYHSLDEDGNYMRFDPEKLR